MHTVHEELIMTNRNITLIAALFQEACIQAPIGNAFQHYMSKPKAPIIKMSYVMFIRNYFWYSIWFDFLCLPICLNSAGLQAKLQGQVSRGSQQSTSMSVVIVFSPNKWNCRRQGRVRCHALTQRSHAAMLASMYYLDEGMSQAHLQAYPEATQCVQMAVGSRKSAIHNAYHILLHP